MSHILVKYVEIGSYLTWWLFLRVANGRNLSVRKIPTIRRRHFQYEQHLQCHSHFKAEKQSNLARHFQQCVYIDSSELPCYQHIFRTCNVNDYTFASHPQCTKQNPYSVSQQYLHTRSRGHIRIVVSTNVEKHFTDNTEEEEERRGEASEEKSVNILKQMENSSKTSLEMFKS